MDPTQRPSFTEIYHRLSFINCQMSTEEEGGSNPQRSKETQNDTIKNGDYYSTNDIQERITKEPNGTCLESSTEDNHESTTHESISHIQALAPVMSNTSRVLRALYMISAICVLVTLIVLNFWQSIYTLISVLVPLTMLTLYPIAIPQRWQQNPWTSKMSGLLYNLGRRLSWNNDPPKKRRRGFSGVNMLLLKSRKSKDIDQANENLPDNVNHISNDVRTIESKHDKFSLNSSNSASHLPNETIQDTNDNEMLQTIPKLARTRRRLSRTLIRGGSFSCHDSIEDHVDES